MPTFDKYIAIDWSGAETEWDSKNKCSRIEVAECDKNGNLSLCVKPNNGIKHYWKRNQIYNKICNIIDTEKKYLIGIDYAFAFPWCDCNSYFPGHIRTPLNRTKLWKQINELCCCNNAFYGGCFFKHDKNLNNTLPVFYEYIMYQRYTGSKYCARKRDTETVCNSNPKTVFKFVGPDQVGTGSVAGMRMLYAIKNKYPNCLIWPFDMYWLDNDNYSGPVIVEIYPGHFHKKAYSERKNYNNANKVKIANIHYNARYNNATNSPDEFDALISAAALRYYATCTKNDYFKPPSMTCCARKYEGWIFGVL